MHNELASKTPCADFIIHVGPLTAVRSTARDPLVASPSLTAVANGASSNAIAQAGEACALPVWHELSMLWLAEAAWLTLRCLWSNLSSKFQVALEVVFAFVAYFVEYRSCASWVWSNTSHFSCSNKNTVEVTSGAFVLVVVHVIVKIVLNLVTKRAHNRRIKI